jgi:hypothetical protein
MLLCQLYEAFNARGDCFDTLKFLKVNLVLVDLYALQTHRYMLAQIQAIHYVIIGARQHRPLPLPL